MVWLCLDCRVEHGLDAALQVLDFGTRRVVADLYLAEFAVQALEALVQFLFGGHW
jgi:hypothetical protein